MNIGKDFSAKHKDIAERLAIPTIHALCKFRGYAVIPTFESYHKGDVLICHPKYGNVWLESEHRDVLSDHHNFDKIRYRFDSIHIPSRKIKNQSFCYFAFNSTCTQFWQMETSWIKQFPLGDEQRCIVDGEWILDRFYNVKKKIGSTFLTQIEFDENRNIKNLIDLDFKES